MNEAQRTKLAERLTDRINGQGPLAPLALGAHRALAARMVKSISADVGWHLEALREAGLLEHAIIRRNGPDSYESEFLYRIADPPPKTIRAGYRKLDDGQWTMTCSEHGDRIDRCKYPESLLSYNRDHPKGHFRAHHADDQVEWDAPPPKVTITYERCRDGIMGRCSAHPYSIRTNPQGGDLERHVDRWHPDADVTYGPIPEPPHEHRLVWSGDDDGLPCVVCADGDLTPFYPQPYPAVGTPYSGPIPAHLQASPEELDTSQRAQTW